MKQAWHQEIFKTIEQCLELKIPIEIVYFPSVGITSSINRYAELAKNNDDSEYKFLVVDLRAATFGNDQVANRDEFYRIVKAHLEQYLEVNIEEAVGQNFYRSIEKIFNSYLQLKKKIIVVFQTASQINLINVKEYHDFLIFIDRLRDTSLGKINILITSTYPQFNESNPAPIPMITKYFNFYKPGWLYKSVNEDMVNESKFRRVASKDSLKLIEISGGLMVAAKAVLRDLTFMDMKLNKIYSLKFDKQFFIEFPNCKLALDRIKKQLRPDVLDGLLKLLNGAKLEDLEEETKDYIVNVGVVDEEGKLRGEMFPAYLKYYCNDLSVNKTFKPESVLVNKTQIEGSDKSVENNNNNSNKNEEFFSVGSKIKVHKNSGEIVINNIPSGEYLSEKELIIFSLLVNKANIEVSREEIGKAIWAEKTNELYSDWAIDKLVSRIREKITDTKPYKFIKTVRNKGFLIII